MQNTQKDKKCSFNEKQIGAKGKKHRIMVRFPGIARLSGKST